MSLELNFPPELELDVDDVDEPLLLEDDLAGHVAQTARLRHVVHLREQQARRLRDVV